MRVEAPVSQTDRQAGWSWQMFESFTCCSSQTAHVNVSLQRWQFSSFSRTFSSELSFQLNIQLLMSRWWTLCLICCLASLWGLTLLHFFCFKKKHFNGIRSFMVSCSPADSQQTRSKQSELFSAHTKMKYGTKSCYLQEFFFPPWSELSLRTLSSFTFLHRYNLQYIYIRKMQLCHAQTIKLYFWKLKINILSKFFFQLSQRTL